jgi:hypothetical protein
MGIKSGVRFGLAPEKNHSGFVPRPSPHGEIQSQCPPPDRTLAVGYRDVRRHKTRGGGAGGDEAAVRGRGLAPQGHGVEARIIAGELLHPGTPPPVSPR